MKTYLRLRNYPGKKSTGKPSANHLKGILTALFTFVAFGLFAQTSFVPVPPTAGANSALSRGPNGSVNFQRTAVIYPASEVSGYPAGFPVKSVGFSILTPANAPATGTIKIYMVNTADATFNRSTNWNTLLNTPTAMQLVYNGPLTIPATAGFYDITLTTPFTITAGSGIYLAYEWETTVKSTGSATYNCNNTLTSGSRTATSATAPPATIATSSNFRPILRLGYTPPANDLKVVSVFSLGKVALSTGTPQQVKAMIANIGTTGATNVVATLNITGANTLTSTVTIPALASGDTTIVTFPNYSSATAGNNAITVTVPADDITGNNAAGVSQIVTGQALSYAVGSPPVATGSVGYTGVSSGTFLARYRTVNTVTVPAVRLYITNNNNLVGKTIYAVVTDSSGNIVGRSPNHIIAGGDLDALISFSITTPSVPVFTNTDFYVGMAIPANTAGSPDQFPLATQPEQYTFTPSRTFTRPQAYYVGTLAGGTKPNQRTNLGRFIIEAETQAVLGINHEEADKAFSIYPNPNNGRFTLVLKEWNGKRTAAILYNATGKQVFTGNLTSQESKLEVKNLAPGMYNLQLLSEGKSLTKRILIE